MVARVVTATRSSVALLVMLMVLGGCNSELWQPNNYQDNPGAPTGGEEFVRIFVNWSGSYNFLSVDHLIPIEIERVAHERDSAAFDEDRVRCMTVSIIGRGALITGLDSEGACEHAEGADAGPDGGGTDGFCEVGELTVNIDRGDTLSSVVRARNAGTGVLRAELFSQRCSNIDDASVIAHDDVFVTFVSTDATPAEVPTDGDADADADDGWGY